MSEVLYQITGKLIGHKQATAFLVSSELAITARHAVEDECVSGAKVKLEFYSLKNSDYTKEIYAIVKAENKKFDIAILELNEPVFIDTLPFLNSKKINSKDNWECVGYPLDWDYDSKGSKFCYIKGEIYQNSSFDETTNYDLHLSGKNIKQEWGSLYGLSGAPILVDDEIRAVVLAQESSIIDSPIKAISISKMATFLESNGVKVNTAFGAKTNHINDRLATHKKNNEELFNKVEFVGSNKNLNLLINSYHIKYDVQGKPKTKQLVEYLVSSISDYAFNLIDTEDMNNGVMKPHVITKKMRQAFSHIQSQGKLGSLLVWMLIEGVFGAPKGIKRISIENETRNFNDLHIGINNEGQLTIFIGEGKLNSDFETAINDAIEAAIFCIDIKHDVLIIDEHFYDQIESENLKKQLISLKKSGTDWNEILLEMTILTGYDSNFLKNVEKKGFSKEIIENIISKKYIEECIYNEKFIYERLKKNNYLKDIKINWFTLPFNTLEDFERMFFDEIN
ncbi:DUF1837 domain-containing protein [Exiguobacterium sp. BG5(2022)]|uniref:DUF1837 domain-containing protein n=1 Tax=Exiguobacterium sp. BG5(2022) TaxID=2962595 RepID=UPI002881F4C3|nr:DUF1837 domain-containing protein [Exiguobacterium sp. BG5(2022)]MDT0192147.1 DUF1837 domain-containing protein [Exiguobacterium sp. BG5(2022)]